MLLARVIGDRRFSDVFLVPWFSTGGAESYLSSIIQALSERNEGRGILVLMGERGAQDCADRHLPASVVVVDLAENIDKALPYLDQMVGSGLVAISDVDVILYRETT